MVQTPNCDEEREALLHALRIFSRSSPISQCISALSCLLKLDPLWWGQALKGKAHEFEVATDRGGGG